MIMNYDEIFDIFKSSYIGKEINKEIIIRQLFNNDDKEIIDKFVNNAHIMYSIKAENINRKAEKNFEEIQIIEIDTNNYRAIYDIYGILLSIIPYPLLAVFKYNDRISFAVSNRILSEEKNNKGKIYTSYLIKEEDIARYLKIEIDSCQSMIDIYNKWISNMEYAMAYYENIEEIMQIIEIGFHIKSEEVLEKLESYIEKYCFTYNMKPKDGWNSKFDKYSESSKNNIKIEIHSLWEYLSENTFLKNRLEYFSDWNEFKDAYAYNNNINNDIYYSQYNSRMSNNEEDDEYIENDNRYIRHNKKIKVETIKNITNNEEDDEHIENRQRIYKS